MSKINVYSSSASNAIKVFDASSTGVKPNNAILVTTGSEPSNAIQINVGEKKWSSIAVNFGGEEPGPGPTWETTTIGEQVWMAENLKYDDCGDDIYHSACVVNGVDFGEQYFYKRSAIQRISADFPGWHIPTQYDIELLQNEVAGDCDSLRTTSGWYNGMNGNDLKEFHAEPLSVYNAPLYVGKRFTFPFTDNSNLLKFICHFSADNRIVSAGLGQQSYYTVRLVKDS